MNTNSNLHSEICEVLDKEFTKDFLQKNWLPFFNKVFPKYGDELRKMGYGLMLPAKFSDIPLKTKPDIYNAIAVLFSGPEPYAYFRECLSQDAQKAWDLLLLNGIMGFYQVKEELGFNMHVISNVQSLYIYTETNINPIYSMFPVKSSSWDRRSDEYAYIYLPRTLRKILINWYKLPPESELTPMETLPQGSQSFNEVEELFFTDFSRLSIYFKQNEISYTTKKRPLPSGLTKVQRMIQIKEFFPNSELKRHKLLRTNMLASIIPHLVNLQKIHSEPHNVLREFFKKNYVGYFSTPPILLPDVKGLGHFEDYIFFNYEFQMLSLLAALPVNSYVPFKNILSHATYKIVHLEVLDRHDAYQKLTLEAGSKDNFKKSIGSNLYKKAIQLPILRGNFFLFAALGLCELVYDEVKADEFGVTVSSAWDGLIAVKRTPLGDYICGLSKEYQVPKTKSIDITLSDTSLLIHLAKADSQYLNTLGNFAEQINALTFKTDARIFLKNIRSKEELNAKIELFKQIFGAELHENWHAFFSNLLKKVNPLKMVSDCFIFKLPMDNKELVKLIAQDPLIKNLVHKAEDYQILVPKSNYLNLKKRLAEFGYLVEW